LPSAEGLSTGLSCMHATVLRVNAEAMRFAIQFIFMETILGAEWDRSGQGSFALA